MKPEAQARALIDAQLEAAGWEIQSYGEADLYAADGIADTARRNQLVMDEVTLDEPLPGDHTEREDATALARRVAEGRVQGFRAFIEAHRDDIDALSIPGGTRGRAVRHALQRAGRADAGPAGAR